MTVAVGQASRRNYRAMKDDKLNKVHNELMVGGDSHTRCVNGGFDPAADLEVVRSIMRERGMTVVAVERPTPIAAAEAGPQMRGPHLASSIKKGGSVDDVPDEWIAEPKLDGWWLQLLVYEEGRVAAWTRQGARVEDRIPHITADFERFSIGTRIVGELCIAGEVSEGGSHKVHQLMRRTTKDPTGEGTRKLQLVAFDCLENDGEDFTASPFTERRRQLEMLAAAGEWDRDGNGEERPIVLIWQWDDTPVSAYKFAVSRGFEGVIAKDPDHVYLPGQRGKGMIKLKSEATVDVFITDVIAGKGEFEGMAGAVEIAQCDDFGIPTVRGTVSSGLNFVERQRLWSQRDEAIRENWCLEMRHMGVQAGGFRHPTFIRWRGDLDAMQIGMHDGR